MSFPLFKFTLSNTIEGTLEIHEPDGWDDGKLELDRNQIYHSLVELYSQPLSFADTVSYNIVTLDELVGGMSWIKNIENTQGLNAIINIQIEISEDGDTYEDIFNGVLDIPTIKETDFYKLECGVKRDDFWSKFINRKSIPINLESTTDLDGNARSFVGGIILPLPSQKMRSRFTRDTNYNDDNLGLFYPAISAAGTTSYLMFDNSRNILDEIVERFEYGNQIASDLPTNVSKYVFLAKYEGSYAIDISIRYFFSLSGSRTFTVKWYLAVKQSGVITTTQIGATQAGTLATIPDDGAKVISTTVALIEGDEIYIYGELGLNSGATVTYFPDYDSDLGGPFAPVYTSVSIVADTIYKDTETDAYLLKDSAESILSKITGADSVVESDYLDSLPDNCSRNYAIMKGLHVRGYEFTEKPFTMSFDDWWNGSNPVLNLGLGYGIGDKIVIEERFFFYDNTPVLNLDFVNNIERSYELESVYKSLEIGYEKWSAESDSGTDDPQTKRKYDTGLATVGKDEKILSKYYAASLGIEQARRNRVEKGKDYRLDEDIMIISVVPDGSDWTPEFDENFTSISNLINSDFRYNLRLTPSYNFLRWRNYFNGCLQIPGGTDYKFSSGEGNYEMVSQLDGGDCESAGSINEGADIPVTSDILCTPVVYSFEHPLTYEQYKTIRDNRNKAIGVSTTDADHVPAHIMTLEYKPTRGLGIFKVKLGA